MKLKILSILATPALLFTACASKPISLQLVGPQPMERNIGYLQVFSPVEEREDADRIYRFRVHRGYSVFSPEGKLIKRMENYVYSSQEETLDLVSLPSGQFQVKANGTHVTVPVIIKPGRTTIVHLDGNWKPPSEVPKDDLVRLPSSGFVGWRGDRGEETPKR